MTGQVLNSRGAEGMGAAGGAYDDLSAEFRTAGGTLALPHPSCRTAGGGDGVGRALPRPVPYCSRRTDGRPMERGPPPAPVGAAVSPFRHPPGSGGFPVSHPQGAPSMRLLARVTTAALIALAPVLAGTPSSAAPAQDPAPLIASKDAVPGHYIVTLDAGIDPATLAGQLKVEPTFTYSKALNGFAVP
ncbi:hypothetical protein Smic_29580 [Streptomyces microflavus]|uniref:Uncharacterized protein n=1 Tax=Streptomyces microflavus TaxID=1919 RepID=A0A7J0CPI0_STRMI|nr:hypothetical protein Smic_29580 [Streptomyces microflavus]